MTNAGPQLTTSTRRRQWVLVTLLIVAGCVNYIDRSTLAIANHDIAQELHLSVGEMGMLLSAFAWTYAIFQLPAGVLTDHAGPHRMLTIGMIVWSLAQLLSGMIQNFGQLLIARAGLGFGESPMFTAGTRACVNWFPIKTRGVPLGLFNAASSLGPAIAPPLLTGLMLAYGWRFMFMLMGVAGFVVAALWGLYYRDPEPAGVSKEERAIINAGVTEPTKTAAPRLWTKLFLIPSTWALMGGLFGIVYVSWLYGAWLPYYLESERHIGIAHAGLLVAIPQFAGFFGGSLGGFLSDWLIRLGVDPIPSRKLLAIGGILIAGLFTALVPFIADTALTLAAISAALFFVYLSSSCSWALGASLTPSHFVATLESIQNIGGSVGGALAPLVTGFVVEYAHTFTPAFALAAGATIFSAGSYALVRKNAYAMLSETSSD